MRVLGIESSCDETALAIVSCGNIARCCHPHEGEDAIMIELNKIYSQTKEHQNFGGVVPEIAARAHIDKLPLMVKDLPLGNVDAIAATTGPGLIGGLHIGYGFGRALALALNKPFYPVHHLEAHALTVRLTDQIDFPYLLLLISGGHTQIIDVQDFRKYKLLGETKDDSCGEVFDKTAKLLNLGFPGGPAIEQAAMHGDPLRYKLPCPFYQKPHCDFSFSGLKTAIRDHVYSLSSSPRMTDRDKSDLCASIQRTISKILIDRLTQALKIAPHKQIVIAGGVAANQYIRGQLSTFCQNNNKTLIVPPVKLCTDNAAMVAWVALEMMQRDITPDIMVPTPRWSLMDLSHV